MTDEQSASMPPHTKIPGQWHDRFFKALFNTPAQVWALLELALTPQQLATLDRHSLVIRPSSLLDQGLKEYVSDLLVEVRLTDGSECVLTLLCEHKSYNDVHLMSQLLSYMARLYEQQAKVVIPIVIYHGERPWTQPRSFYETQHADLSAPLQAVWGHLLLNFGLLLLNLRRAAVLAELRQRPLPAHLGMQVMGELWEAKERQYVAWVARTLAFKRPEYQRFMRLLNIYLMATKPEVNMSQMRELSEMSRPGDPAMREALDLWEKLQPNSAAEFFDVVRQEASQKAHAEGREEGREEGLEEGIQKGSKETSRQIAARMLRQGIAVADVRVATQLSLAELDSLQKGGTQPSDS